jgi:hypothetical protein
MIDKQLRSGIARHKLINSAAETLNLDRAITRFINSGSKCSLGCPGGTYKLLRGYPPSPQLVKLTRPSQNGEGFFLLFYLYKRLYFIF